MNHMDMLGRMRIWIEEELKKAELPGQEAFVMTSLTYCAAKAFEGADDDTKAQAAVMRQEVTAMLQAAAKREPPYSPLDAVRPHRAIFLIDRALALT